ncbi:MAG TPA: NAD(P)/FAD-dependent oxidoreductase [Ignavibacteriaceae bacterium]|jgi:predicted Rossmann fold flavoprotein|nr:NAD(P)/FAD-dependent oxidoreductase [Ignavibacteriaceae bacterium]
MDGKKSKNIVIVGGGAAGFFAAIIAAESNSNNQVVILEKGTEVLSKVKISGGGRCNVTNGCFEPSLLSENYPRGAKELKGLFFKFNSSGTIEWFESKGVKLKTEKDGRVFPVSNKSQTIIDCFLNTADFLKIETQTSQHVVDLVPPKDEKDKWSVVTKSNDSFFADAVIVTSGGSDSTWKILEKLGHTIITPVPSLFSFIIKSRIIDNLEGVAVEDVEISTVDKKIRTDGAVLITHKGLSGPAVLKLSAFGARAFHDSKYNYKININWMPGFNFDSVCDYLKVYRNSNLMKGASVKPFQNIPRRLWQRFLELAGIEEKKKWNQIPNEKLFELCRIITNSEMTVTGRNTNKEEFVTAGGVKLDEVNFKRMESRLHKGLFFAGEVLDIDGLTGGFNFQAAWTTAYIAGNSV